MCTVDKNTESEILSELKNINKSLQDMNKKIDDSDGKPSLIWDVIKSLLIGVFIVGPGIAVAIGIYQIISSWIIN